MHTRPVWQPACIMAVSLLLASMACQFPGMASTAPTADETSIARQVEQTIQALAPSLIPTASATPENLPADTAIPPTQTIAATDTLPLPTDTIAVPPTAIPPTLTPFPTLGPPLISATIDTNCRYGPDKLYPVIDYLLVGQQSTVHGRNEDGTWWYIAAPKKAGLFCWAWGEYTVVQGDTSLLPIIAPPPTPTPVPGLDIGLYFSNFHFCGGTLTAILQVVNNSPEVLKSIRLTIIEFTSSTGLYGPAVTNSPFGGGPGMCPSGGDNLLPFLTGYIGGEIGPMVSGATLQANVTVCTEKNLGGVCENRSVKFVVP